MMRRWKWAESRRCWIGERRDMKKDSSMDMKAHSLVRPYYNQKPKSVKRLAWKQGSWERNE